MLNPFVGEIQMFGFNFAPRGWLACDGQLLNTADYSTLFTLIGTTYGGDGVTTFALPDLRGRAYLGSGQGPSLTNRAFGVAGGEAAHALTTAEMPVHQHGAVGLSSAGDNADPTGRYPATAPTGLGNTYGPAGSTVALGSAALGSAGSGQAHTNQQPYLAVTICIATEGVYPSQN